MNEEKGRPLQARVRRPNSPNRTDNTVPHRATTTEVVVFHLIIAPLVLAVIVALAGLIWALAAVTS